jgi:hypothetical protein
MSHQPDDLSRERRPSVSPHRHHLAGRPRVSALRESAETDVRSVPKATPGRCVGFALDCDKKKARVLDIPHVRLGSLADIGRLIRDVCFTL